MIGRGRRGAQGRRRPRPGSELEALLGTRVYLEMPRSGSSATGSAAPRPSIGWASRDPGSPRSAGRNPTRAQVAAPRMPGDRVPTRRGHDRFGSRGTPRDMRHRSVAPSRTPGDGGSRHSSPWPSILAACSSESGPENGQNSLRPAGRATPQKIDNLFTPDHRGSPSSSASSSSARRSSSRSASASARAATTARSRSTATPRSRSAGRSIPALILAVIAVPTVSLIFDLTEKPAPTRSRSPSSASSGGGSSTTRAGRRRPEGRHRRRAAHPDRARRATSTLDRVRRVAGPTGSRRLQRDPQLLGAGARGQARRRPRPRQHA